jgi:hypothetical protein
MGVHEGYFHENEVPTDSKVCEDIMRIADQVQTETGIYIGLVVFPAKVLYKEEWGCPKGGECVFVITGNNFFNSKDGDEIASWRNTAKALLLRIKDHFKQSTIQVEWVKKTITRYATEK